MHHNGLPGRRLVAVLGMHRSGTSAITRALSALGVGLGDRLMPAQPVNPKGFWEDLDIHELNVRMLEEIHMEWHALAALEPAQVDALREAGYVQAAAALLRRKLSETPVFGFKDPRVARLLPVWKEAILQTGVRAAYVLTLRHPLSVVRSLADALGFEAERTYVLWLLHVLSAISQTAGENRVLVDYDLLLQVPQRELAHIGSQLGLAVDPDAARAYEADFLDPKLRHSVHSLDDLSRDSACPPLVIEIYACLRDIVLNRCALDDGKLAAVCADWHREFARSSPLLKLADSLSAQRRRLEQLTAEQAQTIAVVTRSNHDREHRIQALLASTSWKVTAPLRALRRLIK